ncbi:hypothetical protein [Streptomyces ambofaciens]
MRQQRRHVGEGDRAHLGGWNPHDPVLGGRRRDVFRRVEGLCGAKDGVRDPGPPDHGLPVPERPEDTLTADTVHADDGEAHMMTDAGRGPGPEEFTGGSGPGVHEGRLVHDQTVILREGADVGGRLMGEIDDHGTPPQRLGDLVAGGRVRAARGLDEDDLMSVVPDPERGLDAHEASTVDHHDLHTSDPPGLVPPTGPCEQPRDGVGASTGDRLSV